jgi:hypothetical protein
MLVWLRLKNLAYQTSQTIYKIKHNLLVFLSDSATKTSRRLYVFGLISSTAWRGEVSPDLCASCVSPDEVWISTFNQ